LLFGAVTCCSSERCWTSRMRRGLPARAGSNPAGGRRPDAYAAFSSGVFVKMNSMF
jgi:hypothetical protein